MSAETVFDAALLCGLFAVWLWTREMERRHVLLKGVVQDILEHREPFQAVPPPRITTTATEAPAEVKPKRTYKPRKPKVAAPVRVELTEAVAAVSAPAEVAP